MLHTFTWINQPSGGGDSHVSVRQGPDILRVQHPFVVGQALEERDQDASWTDYRFQCSRDACPGDRYSSQDARGIHQGTDSPVQRRWIRCDQAAATDWSPRGLDRGRPIRYRRDCYSTSAGVWPAVQSMVPAQASEVPCSRHQNDSSGQPYDDSLRVEERTGIVSTNKNLEELQRSGLRC